MVNFIDLSNDTSSSDAESEVVDLNARKNYPTLSSSNVHTVNGVEDTSSKLKIIQVLSDGEENKRVNITTRTVHIEENQLRTIGNQNSPVRSHTDSPAETNRLRKKVRLLKRNIATLQKEVAKYWTVDKQSKIQNLTIQKLEKINQEWEMNYKKLESKYEDLKKKQVAVNRKNLSSKHASQQEKRNSDDIFSIDFANGNDESIVPVGSVLDEEEKNMYRELNYEAELSEKDFEIRRQKKHLQALKERFKSKDESERAVKRKLKDVESEKEKANKKLRVVEQEKEKLEDELECTTLCGFCQENVKDMVFDPCGHIWACAKCVTFAKMTKCPCCQKKIRNVRKVFIA